MELTGLTRDNLDDRLRVEVGVDVLAGRVPPPRLVVFGRRRAVLVAEGRDRRPDEDPLEPLVELTYLARTLRPRAFALAFPLRAAPVDEDPCGLELRVLAVERHVVGRSIEHREHPFALSDEGLPTWDAPRRTPIPPAFDGLAGAVLRSGPRRLRRRPGLVARVLASDGHRVAMTPPLAARLAGAGPVTFAS